MAGWLAGWLDGWMDGCTNEFGKLTESVGQLMGGWLAGEMNKIVEDRCLHGWMDRWMDEFGLDS